MEIREATVADIAEQVLGRNTIKQQHRNQALGGNEELGQQVGAGYEA